MSPLVRRAFMGLVVLVVGLAGPTGRAQVGPGTGTLPAPQAPDERRRMLATSSDEGDFYVYDGARQALRRSRTTLAIRLQSTSADRAPDVLTTLLPAATQGPVVSSQGRDYHLVTLLAETSAVAGRQQAASVQSQPDVEFVTPVYVYPATGSWLFPTDEILVKVRPGIDGQSLDALAASQGLRVTRRLPESPDEYALEMVDAKSGDPLAIANALNDSALLTWAEPNFVQQLDRAAAPNDALYPQQWHLRNTGQGGGKPGADVKIQEAWDITAGSSSIVIAVIDDGVERSHEDLAANIFTNPREIAGNGVDDDNNGFVDDVNGWDFDANDNNPDPQGSDYHGTPVAGVAAGRGGNGIGIAGACQSCRILPVRAGATMAGLASAIRYAAQFADILNNSWKIGAPVNVIQSAVEFAATQGRSGKGAIVLVASGNSASGLVPAPILQLPAGTHRFRWTYGKDFSGSAGEDSAWLAWVLFPGGQLETFQNGAPGWTWSGSAPWTIVTDPTHADESLCLTKALRSGAIGNNQLTSVQVTKTLPAGPFTYNYWVSSEEFFDGLYLEIDLGNDGLFEFSTQLLTGVPPVTQPVAFPASVPESIAVGASSNLDCRSSYSQFGPELAFVAPSSGGVLNTQITTTDRTGAAGTASTQYTTTFGGTSSATPLAAGIAGLILSRNPTLTRAQVLQIMTSTADSVGPEPYVGGRNNRYGYGRLNAYRALLATPVPPVAPTAEPDAYATPFNTPLTVNAPGVLANDNSNGGGTMTASQLSAPTNGTLALGVGGGFTYSPRSGFTGTDSFTYRAETAVGRGNPATVTIVVAPPVGPTPPGAPTTFVAVASGSTLSLTWAAPTSGGSPTSYTLVARTSPGGPVLATLPLGNVLSALLTAPNGVFVLSIFATNAAGAGPESNPATVAVPGAVAPPSNPTNLTVSVSGTTANFAWSAPASGGPVESYVLIAGFTPGFSVAAASLALPPSPPGVSVPGVPPGTYYVRVYSRNTAGNSQFSSNEVVVFVGGGPAVPAAPTMNPPSVSGDRLTLSWSPGGGGAPTSYVLAAAATPGGNPLATVPLAGTSVTFTGVPPGTYFLRITATNPAGTSPPSNEVVAVVQASAPAIPQDATYRVTISGRILQSGGVTSTFSRDATVLVTPPVDPLAQGVSNGPNPRDVSILTDASPIVGIAGALWFGTNTGFCSAVGCEYNQNGLDTTFVTINQSTGELQATVDGNVFGLPLARLNFFNIFNALTSVTAQIYHVLAGDVSLRFANGGQSLSGTIRLGGNSGFSGPAVSTLYDATVTGVRTR